MGILRNAALNGRVWPGDFNGDGVTDFVANEASISGVVLVATGKGDGTFNAPVTSTVHAYVLGVGDMTANEPAVP